MYQFAVYSYMTYKIYYDYHDVVYHMGMVCNGISSAVGWFRKRTSTDDQYAYIDWILVNDLEPEPLMALLPSAPPFVITDSQPILQSF